MFTSCKVITKQIVEHWKRYKFAVARNDISFYKFRNFKKKTNYGMLWHENAAAP
jgi:hypothetical protein